MRTVAERLAGQAAVVQINTEESPQLAARFNIRGIPAVLLLRHGQVVDQISGAQTPEALLAWFERQR